MLVRKVLVICVVLLAACIDSAEVSNDTSATVPTTPKAPNPYNMEPSAIWAAHEAVNDAMAAVMTEEVRGNHSWRLPNTSHPLQYWLQISTNIHRGEQQFEGNCTVDIQVDQHTEQLVLHSLFLQVLYVSVQDIETRTYLPHVRYSQIFDKLLIESEETNGTSRIFLPAQQLRVTILYYGHIWSGVFGLHTFRYQDARQQPVMGAATLLQPFYARTMFPCYDEPHYRANFTVHVTHGSNFTALSNMPEESVATASVPGMFTTSFLTSPAMPSYLLAITLSTYVRISEVDEAGVLHRLFITSASTKNFQPALENAKRALKALNDYFQVPFVLPKLDSFIEVHNETLIEGMENWGLIIYDQELPHENFTDIRKHVGNFILQYHETVHQWFGNLVTPKWWNHLWLSEGFATYYSYRLFDMLQPDYESMDIFQMDVCYWAMFNMILTTKASKQFVDGDLNYTNFESIFNIQSYYRAPCVIQMFDHALGQEAFHKGIVMFLKENSSSAVEANDLFNALQSVMEAHYPSVLHQSWNYSVHDLMQPWFESKGCPLVTVTRNYDPANMHLVRIQQTPMSWLDNKANASAQLWWIPLNFATQSQSDFSTTSAEIFMPPVPEMTIDLRELNVTLQPDDWLVVNKHAQFYYHVKYDRRNLRRIGNALQQHHQAMPRRNRWQILHTLYELLTTIESDGTISTSANFTDDFLELLSFMRALANETDLFVWSLTSQVVTYHYQTFRWPKNDKLWTMHRQFVSHLMAPTFEYYRLKAESPSGLSALERLALQNFIDLACIVELPACLDEAKTMVLYKLARKHESAEPQQPLPRPSSLMWNISLSQPILCAAAANLSDADFERALQFYTSKDGNWESLSCTRKLEQFEKLLQWAGHIHANESATRCADKMEFMASLVDTASPEQQPLLMSFIDEHLLPAKDTNPCFMKFCEELNVLKIVIHEAHNKKVMELLQVWQEHRLNGPTKESDSLSGRKDVKQIYSQANVERIHEWLQEANAAFLNSVDTSH